jgi:uncharacterized membrane protein
MTIIQNARKAIEDAVITIIITAVGLVIAVVALVAIIQTISPLGFGIAFLLGVVATHLYYTKIHTP